MVMSHVAALPWGKNTTGAGFERARLSLREVALTRTSGDLLGPVTITLGQDEILGLIGPTGGGKSDLLAAASGRITPRSGSVLVDGAVIDEMSVGERIRDGLAEVRGPAPKLPGVRVLDRLMLAMQFVDHSPWRHLTRRRSGLDDGQMEDIEAVLDFCGIIDIARDPLTTLSLPQLRLVEIARALCQRPRILLLDRPLAGAMTDQRERLVRLIEAIRSEAVSILVADDGLDVMGRLCDRLAVVDHGHVVVEGSLEQVTRDPTAIRVFTGAGMAETGA